MRNGNWIVLAVLGVLLLSLTATADEEAHFEYPYYVVGAHDPDGNGLYGMNASGSWYPFVTVDPNIWLVGPPLSDVSAVTLPTDHWVELQFRGPIVDGPGYDIEILERGRVSEQALVFFTDGHDKEYLYTLIEAWDTGTNLSSYLQLDIAGLNLPFEPRAIRIIGLDTGGDCWGFDLQSVTARICTQCNDYPACNPIPVNGERRVALDTPLSWWPGDSAIKHIVYFGVCPNDVGPDATPVSSPTQGQDANSFDPGPLELAGAGGRYGR